MSEEPTIATVAISVLHMKVDRNYASFEGNELRHISSQYGYAVRKFVLLVGLILGAGVGLLTSLTDGIGLKIVMMSIGAIAGAAIGGALSKTGRRVPIRPDSIPGMGSFSEEQMRNYWRDKGEIYPAPGHPDPEGARGEFDRAP